MIILDGLPDPQKRRVFRRSSTPVSEVDSIQSSEAAPPSYRSYTSRNSLQPMLEAEPPHLQPPKVTKVQKIWPRLKKGLLYALALYAVITIAVAVPYFVTQSRKLSTYMYTPYQRMRPPDPSMEPGDNEGQTIVPMIVPPADGQALACNEWDYTNEYGYPDNLKYSRLTYCIPNNATNFFIHALGGRERFVSGTFIFKLNPDADEVDYMVDIILTYPKDDVTAKDSSAICLMQANDTWGVGIYTPSGSANHFLDYQLTFLVPQRTETPLLLSQFTSNLPWFSHIFQDLNSSLSFRNVEVSGVSSSVHGIIQAENVNITTSRAPITGSFRAMDTLILQTSHAKIDANITLSNWAGQKGATTLYMRSSAGPLFATVNLSTSGTEKQTRSELNPKPQYRTNVSCDDSPVTLVFRHDDTVNSSGLDVQLNTTLNRAVVLLDNKFEGSFYLYSKNGSVIVADLDGNEYHAPIGFAGAFPDNRCSLVRDNESRCTRRYIEHGVERRGSDQNVNVLVQNCLALIALGFVGPDGKFPHISGIELAG